MGGLQTDAWPYTACRNPLYFGLLFIGAPGFAVAFNSAWIAVAGLPLWLYFDRVVVAAEEGLLAAEFCAMRGVCRVHCGSATLAVFKSGIWKRATGRAATQQAMNMTLSSDATATTCRSCSALPPPTFRALPLAHIPHRPTGCAVSPADVPRSVRLDSKLRPKINKAL